MWFGQSPSAAQERGGPLPSIAVADALLDKRRDLAEWGHNPKAVLTITVTAQAN